MGYDPTSNDLEPRPWRPSPAARPDVVTHVSGTLLFTQLCARTDNEAVASRKGVEPLTPGLGNLCSILLSYRDHDLPLPQAYRMGRSVAGVAWRLIALLSASWGAGAGAARADDACQAIGQTAEVAAVLDDLELALDDGRVVRLAGLDPARATPDRPALAADARSAFQLLLGGRRVRVRPLAASPDRWDRVPALVGVEAATTDPQPTSTLNEALIEAGWARARPETLPSPCLMTFMTAEAQARARGFGLWADPYYAIIPASDANGLARRTGAMAIVEGVVNVRHERYRTIVSFGPRIGRDLTAAVARQNEKKLAKAGLDLQKLVGREVRIRGFLDDRFGPRIDLVDPGQVEVVGPRDPSLGAAHITGAGSPD